MSIFDAMSRKDSTTAQVVNQIEHSIEDTMTIEKCFIFSLQNRVLKSHSRIVKISDMPKVLIDVFDKK